LEHEYSFRTHDKLANVDSSCENGLGLAPRFNQSVLNFVEISIALISFDIRLGVPLHVMQRYEDFLVSSKLSLPSVLRVVLAK
jgi:hypothetical protein